MVESCKELKQTIFDFWECCEKQCKKYKQCNKVKALDNIVRELWS